MTSELDEHTLARAEWRLRFPPSYVVVGVWRLFTDPLLYGPAWEKCKHATQRGALVGSVWAVLSFGIQREFIELFLINSKRITGLSPTALFGYKVPFSISTYATFIFLSHQTTAILKFFLARNISIARERAWDQTVASRGKGPDFWGPYVEEWDTPPVLVDGDEGVWARFMQSWFGRFVIMRVLLVHFSLYPFVGLLVSASFKALGTAQYLHKAYFASKKMTPYQQRVFIRERQWDYRWFGFVAALLEGLPVIGLGFTLSNRIGAAMWAHDLEKRQHFVAARKLRRE